MTPDKWQEVKEIFNEAVEMPVGDREKFLAGRINGNEELRREVEKLLAADEEAKTLFDGKSLISSNDPAGEKQFGIYRVVRKIGAGGMGAVYLAERTDLKQRVALKIIRHGADSETILRRFRREQEILAALEHPNIARLLDVGISSEGIPFLAMEFVEGVDLNEFCEGKNLSVNEKLRLFRKICEAVAYAHSRLVVHRDLKPSNILVNEQGEPKLLDFGISKLLDEAEPEIVEKGTVTSMGMLTPNYASPEQFRGETVSTATDVYSLGVILYEMLTAALPYQISGKRFDEVARAVIETEPNRPSSVVFRHSPTTRNSTDENKGQRTKSKGQTTNGKFLRGDLDNIILKALRKEPDRRYSSVEKFSDDVRRHLEGLPVAARPDTFSYRAEKFISRNRFAAAAGLIILLTLIGGIAATSWQAVRAERQRALAEKRFNEVRRIANNVVYKYHDEIENLAGATKVREILITDAVAYLDQLAQDSADDLSLKQELARSYIRVGGLQTGIHGSSGIGESSAGIESFKKAVALLEESAAKNESLSLLSDLRLAYSDLGLAYNRAGNDEKIIYLKKALELSERLTNAEPDNLQRKIALAGDLTNLGDATPNEDSAAVNKGEVYFGNNDFYRRGLEIAESVLQKEPENDRALEKKLQAASRLSANYQMSADAFKQRGDEAKTAEAAGKALEYIQQARTVAEKLAALEPDNADWQYNASAIRWNESLIQLIVGNAADALKIQSAEIVKVENAAQSEPENAEAQHNLAVMYDGLTSTYSNLKNYSEAEKYQRKALEIVDRIIARDEENLEYRQTRRDIAAHAGEIAANENDFEKAAKIYQAAYQQYVESPSLKEKTSEIGYYKGLMHQKIGDVYLQAAKNEASNRNASRTQAKNAAGHFQTALGFWQNQAVADEFFKENQDEIESIKRKISDCDEKIATL